MKFTTLFGFELKLRYVSRGVFRNGVLKVGWGGGGEGVRRDCRCYSSYFLFALSGQI